MKEPQFQDYVEAGARCGATSLGPAYSAFAKAWRAWSDAATPAEQRAAYAQAEAALDRLCTKSKPRRQ